MRTVLREIYAVHSDLHVRVPRSSRRRRYAHQLRGPGNVRGLGNAIERAVILADDGAVITQSLLAIDPASSPVSEQDEADEKQTSLEDYFVRFVQENEDFLTETQLAAQLGISRKSLWERRQRLNIPRKKTQQRGLREQT